MTQLRLASGLLLLVALLMAASSPVFAQSGSSIVFKQTCIAIAPGEAAQDEFNVSVPAGTAAVQITAVGITPTSPPKGWTVSLSPAGGTLSKGWNVTTASGPAGTQVNITIGTNTSTSSGTYQIGLVAKAGSSFYKMTSNFLTLRVLKAGQSTDTCSSVGLPLPEPTFIVTLTSVGLGLFTQLVTRRFVDLDAERRMKAELNAFNKEKRAATLAKDKEKLEKLKKKDLAMMQERSKVQLARTKVTFITIVPLFLIYYLMASFLGGYGTIVAVSPLPIPYLVGGSGEMVLFWWYIIGSFTLSSLLSRLLRTNT